MQTAQSRRCSPLSRSRAAATRVLACALALVVAGTARADGTASEERVILLAPELSARQVAEVARGLGTAGVRAVSVQQAELDATFAACRVMACVVEAARVSGSRAVFVRLDEGAQPSGPSLLWVLVAADGSRAQARVHARGGDLERAAADAWAETSLELVLGGDALIRLVTTPSGATVWLDGERLGTTPFAERVAPGEHRLVANLDGFVSQERVVNAEAGRAHQVQMRLTRPLSFEGETASVPAAQTRGPWNYVLGGTLALIALPALITAVNTLANDGQCVDYAADGSCLGRAEFGTESALVLMFGVVSFSTGATIVSVQPIGPPSGVASAAGGRAF
jgi:PEGA domain